MKPKKSFDILRDKNGYFSLRESVTALFVVVMVVAWVAQQFFNTPIPEFMFYAFASLVGAGCFGYSLERKQKPFHNPFKKQLYNEED